MFEESLRITENELPQEPIWCRTDLKHHITQLHTVLAKLELSWVFHLYKPSCLTIFSAHFVVSSEISQQLWDEES